MRYCPKCKKEVPENARECEACNYSDADGSSFLISYTIGEMTDNAILGGIVGGDMTGGTLGDIMHDGELDAFGGDDSGDD